MSTFEQTQQEWLAAGGSILNLEFSHDDYIHVGTGKNKFRVLSRKTPTGWTVSYTIFGCAPSFVSEQFSTIDEAIKFAHSKIGN